MAKIKVNNPDFNYGEYATITSRAGAYEYAHKDIAFEFASMKLKS
jgi:hypothetical protein